MIGISGSGKSTWANKFMANDGSETAYLNADSVRKELYGDESVQGDGAKVFGILNRRFSDALKHQVDVIMLDNTALIPKGRKMYIKEAIEHGYQVTLVYFSVPLKTALERNRMRPRQVPEEVIKNQFAKLQSPSAEERKTCKVIEVKS